MLHLTSRYAAAASVALGAVALTACATVGAMLEAPTSEVGNTYALNGSKMFCTPEREKCYTESNGNFTVDNGAVLANKPIAIIHLVFDDGHDAWVSYDAFVEQRFGPPIATRRKVKHDMSPAEVEVTWGRPDTSAPEDYHGVRLQVWTYNGVGRISFRDDKVINVELKKSLLAAN